MVDNHEPSCDVADIPIYKLYVEFENDIVPLNKFTDNEVRSILRSARKGFITLYIQAELVNEHD